MSEKEQREHARLLRLWATCRATRKQIERCQELDRRQFVDRLVTSYTKRA